MLTELQEEQASLYALGLLQESEVTTFQREMLAKPELQLLVEDLQFCRDLAILNGVTQTPPPALKNKVLTHLYSTSPIPSTATLPNPTKAQPSNIHPFRIILPWSLAACLAICLIILCLDREKNLARTAQLQKEIRQKETLLGALKKDNTRQAKTITHLESQNLLQASTIAQLRATSDQAEPWSKSTVSVLWDKNRQEGILILSNMPEAGSGKTYQLWAIDPQVGSPVSAGVFQVQPDQSIRIPFKTASPVLNAAQFAVSLEEGGSKEAPEGPVILAGSSL
jgi:anti-sigma-K factor RskA